MGCALTAKNLEQKVVFENKFFDKKNHHVEFLPKFAVGIL